MKATYKILVETAHLEDVVVLQKEIWGPDVVVPLPQLVAAIHNGGVTIGAIMEGKLIGFCYAFPGYNGEETYLYSHMLGIHPDYRNLGIGKELKLEQRHWALKHGYDKMMWTYDPLETRNGYLNISKLGGHVQTYLPSYYGDMQDQVNKGLPSDRFLVEWSLSSQRVEQAVHGRGLDTTKWVGYPKLLNWKQLGRYPQPGKEGKVGAADGYLIPVPKETQDMKQNDMQRAIEWRLMLRNLFSECFSKDYILVGLLRSDNESVHYYVLQRKDKTDDKRF